MVNPPDPIELLEYALATYRISLLLAKEKGPNELMCRLRGWFCKCRFGKYLPNDCLWCWSIWVALTLGIYRMCADYGDLPGLDLPFFVVRLPIHWLAFSAVAIILNQQFTQDKD